jgi:hypothetical protein
MASNQATLIVKILTDASGAKKGTEQAASAYQKFGAGIQKLTPYAAGAAAAIIGIGAKAVSAASATEQAMGSLDAVFGKNAGQVKGWAASAAKSLGLSKSQYGEFAAVIGAQLNNLGLSADDALKGTKDLISLGADLSATFGGTTADAVSALSAALRGEGDPAERYGLSLNQTAVNARLAEKGLDKLTGSALKTAKTQTILQLATEQAGGAVGQFAAQSSTLAEQQQINDAAWQNALSTLGTQLLPIVTKVTQQFASLAQWISQNSTLVTAIVAVIGTLAAIILVLAAAMKIATIVQWALNSAIFASPITWVIALIVLLVATIVILWNKSAAFRDFFINAWKVIKNAVSAAFTWISNVAKSAFAGLIVAANAVASFFRTIFSAVAGFFSSIWSGAVNKVKLLFYAFGVAARIIFSGIQSAIGAVGRFFSSIWSNVVNAAKTVLAGFGSFFRGLFNSLMAPVRAVESAIQGIIGWIQKAIGWLSRIKIPSILSKQNFSAPPPAGVNGTPPAGVLRSPSLGGVLATSSTGSGGGGIVININGGLDSAETIARRVQSLLVGSQRRRSGVVLDRRSPAVTP